MFCHSATLLYRLVFHLLIFESLESPRHFFVLFTCCCSVLGKIIKVFFYHFGWNILFSGYESIYIFSDLMESRVRLEKKKMLISAFCVDNFDTWVILILAAPNIGSPIIFNFNVAIIYVNKAMFLAKKFD